MGTSRTPDGPTLTPLLSSESLAALVSAVQSLAQIAQALTGQAAGTLAPVPPPLAPVPDSVTLAEAVNSFIVAKARSGRSDRYLRQLRSSLGLFAKGRVRRPLASLTADEIERWAARQDLAARTRAGHIRDLRTLLAWCQRRGWIRENVAQGVELPRGADIRSIAIHTPAEVAQLLAVAYEVDPNVGRHLAVRYFCGVRSAEAHRLREENLRNGFLEVTAAASKTRARRLIRIRPNLEAWLALGGELRPLSPNTVQRVIRASGVAWPHNVTRHSFCSYHLAAFENSGRTALEAGHAEAVLFRHYRALVSKAEAEAYWSLAPQ